MVYPTDEETFDARATPEWIRQGHLNAVQAFLKRIQDFLGYGGRLHDEAGLVMPVGSIVSYTGEAAPSGWLLCDGMYYLRADALYSDLFAVIGTKYGFNGVNYFNVPDLRGYFLRGWVGIPDKTFVPADVSTGSDFITLIAHKYYNDANPVRFSTTDTLPAPLAINTTYWTIGQWADLIRVAATRADAIARNYIDITTQGVGTHTIYSYREEDKDSRLASSGQGNTGEDLGTFQPDAEQGVGQLLGSPGYGWICPAGGGSNGERTALGARDTAAWSQTVDSYVDIGYGAPRISVETRPRNVNVNYIIKR